MAAREFIQKNGAWLVVIAIAGAGAALYISRSAGGYHPPHNAYFVDEETGEEVVRPLTDIPPLAGKSGKPTVVREFKYSLDGGKTVKIGYYFKYSDAMKTKLDEGIAAGKGGELDGTPGEFVRSPEATSKWVSISTPEGQAISHVEIPPNADVQIVSP